MTELWNSNEQNDGDRKKTQMTEELNEDGK